MSLRAHKTIEREELNECERVPELEERVLSEKDHDFFETNGYVVIHNAVPQKDSDAVIDTIWDFMEFNKNNLSGCYKKPAVPIGFVELYHHQTLWNNRTNPRIYGAFSELLKTDKLWCSIDRCSMKLPSNPNFPSFEHKGFLHWDYDPWNKEKVFGLQGVLCLADTAVNQGGFHCIPGMHRWIDEYSSKQEKPVSHCRRFEDKGIPINVPERRRPFNRVPVEAKAGDLIIWRRETAHGSGHNISGLPRFAQYITMFPELGNSQVRPTNQQSLDRDLKWDRINYWENRISPSKFPGDYRKKEQAQFKTAELTDLGRRLLGLDAWD